MDLSFLLNLLLMLLVLCVVFWAARAIMAACGIGDPIATIVYVVLVLIVLVAIIQGGLLRGGLRIT
jgi:uncharacterized membrane protein YwzB